MFLFHCTYNSPEVSNFLSFFFLVSYQNFISFSFLFSFQNFWFLSKNYSVFLDVLVSSRYIWFSSKMFILVFFQIFGFLLKLLFWCPIIFFILVYFQNFVVFISPKIVGFLLKIFVSLQNTFCFPSKIFGFVLKFLFWLPSQIFILVSFQNSWFSFLLTFLF